MTTSVPAHTAHTAHSTEERIRTLVVSGGRLELAAELLGERPADLLSLLLDPEQQQEFAAAAKVQIALQQLELLSSLKTHFEDILSDISASEARQLYTTLLQSFTNLLAPAAPAACADGPRAGAQSGAVANVNINFGEKLDDAHERIASRLVTATAHGPTTRSDSESDVGGSDGAPVRLGLLGAPGTAGADERPMADLADHDG